MLLLEVTFPARYPEEYCEVELSASPGLSSDIVTSGNEAIRQYWNSSMLGKLMFRPFLHWWDNNLVQILQAPFSTSGDTEMLKGVCCGSGSDGEDGSDGEGGSEEDVAEEQPQPSVKSKRGTEIRLLGVDVSQTLGTAFWTAVKIVVSCERCKNHQEMEVKEEKLVTIFLELI